MDIVNADYGIDSVPANPIDRTWYRWHRFPLLPIISFIPENEWNESRFSFSWLNVRVWSMMSISLEIGIDFNDVGLRVFGQLL